MTPTKAIVELGDYGHRSEITIQHGDYRAFVYFNDNDDLEVVAKRLELLAVQVRRITKREEKLKSLSKVIK